jgi:hypothetical protein
MFGVSNIATSPMLTYAFEYAWLSCCQAPPGPDGVVPVSSTKAITYRILSVSRTLGMALAFGNGIASSLVVTTGIQTTRTMAYLVNDYVWGHLASSSTTTAPPSPPPAAEEPKIAIRPVR